MIEVRAWKKAVIKRYEAALIATGCEAEAKSYVAEKEEMSISDLEAILKEKSNAG